MQIRLYLAGGKHSFKSYRNKFSAAFWWCSNWLDMLLEFSVRGRAKEQFEFENVRIVVVSVTSWRIGCDLNDRRTMANKGDVVDSSN